MGALFNIIGHDVFYWLNVLCQTLHWYNVYLLIYETVIRTRCNKCNVSLQPTSIDWWFLSKPTLITNYICVYEYELYVLYMAHILDVCLLAYCFPYVAFIVFCEKVMDYQQNYHCLITSFNTLIYIVTCQFIITPLLLLICNCFQISSLTSIKYYYH